MDKNSILEFNNKESVSDVLNELLRSGAQKLIYNKVEAELREFSIFNLFTFTFEMFYIRNYCTCNTC